MTEVEWRVLISTIASLLLALNAVWADQMYVPYKSNRNRVVALCVLTTQTLILWGLWKLW